MRKTKSYWKYRKTKTHYSETNHKLNNIHIVVNIIAVIITTIATVTIGYSVNVISKDSNEISKRSSAVDFFVSSKNDDIIVEMTDGRATNINVKVYYVFKKYNDSNGKRAVIEDASYFDQNKEQKNGYSIRFIHNNYDQRNILYKLESSEYTLRFAFKSFKIVEINYTDNQSEFKKKFFSEELDYRDLSSEKIDEYVMVGDFPTYYAAITEEEISGEDVFWQRSSPIISENKKDYEEIQSSMADSLIKAFFSDNDVK